MMIIMLIIIMSCCYINFSRHSLILSNSLQNISTLIYTLFTNLGMTRINWKTDRATIEGILLLHLMELLWPTAHIA